MASEKGSQGSKAQAIKEELDNELMERASEVGVPVDETIQQKITKHEGYDASTVVNFVSSELRQLIDAEQAETHKGILMGSRDRHGRNWPRRYSLIKSSGDHIEIDSFDGSLPGPEGEEVDIPVGGHKVTIRCDYDDDYDSWNAKMLERSEPMDGAELANALSQVAVEPDDISAADEETVVAVKGTVSWLEPQTLFDEDGQPSKDGPVMMTDDRGELQPHFEISLAREGEASVTGHAERQAYARPYFAVTDLMRSVTDAVDQYESPGKQADFVRSAVQGRDVVIVGNVNNFNTDRDGDGNPIKYIHIGVTAIVEIPEDGEEADAISETGDEEPADEAGEPYEESEDSDGPAVDDVADSIEQYADLVGEDVGSLTAGEIKEKAPGIEAPESIIEHALGQLQGGEETEEEPEESGESESQSPEEEFAALKQGNMFQCPDGSCTGKGSSVADLMFHVVDDHEAANGEEAREWVEQRM